MFKKLFLFLVVVMVLIPFKANAEPLENYGHNITAYTMYDARTSVSSLMGNITDQTGGWHLVIEMDDELGAFEDLKTAKLINRTNGMTLIAEPQTFQKYYWLGRYLLVWDVWLGHEWNAMGEWRAVIINQAGERFATRFFLTETELHVPKPPFVEVLHVQPVEGGTLITFKAPYPGRTGYFGDFSIRLRILDDVDNDGQFDDCIHEYRNDTDFSFDPTNDTTTFLVPYSGKRGRFA